MPVAQFLDKILPPLVKYTKSLIQDTNDFLQKLRNVQQCQANEILVTWDVNSLYTSIPHRSKKAETTQNRKYLCLRNSLKSFCLTIICLFQYQFFVQLNGVALGSNVAPPFACAFMNVFQQKYIHQNDLFMTHCATWWCFIDDVFAIWRGDMESLNRFNEMFNGFSLEIKFKMHVGGTSVPFLDSRIYINNNMIESDLFSKPTHGNKLLLFDSFPLLHGFKFIGQNQLCRVKRK